MPKILYQNREYEFQNNSNITMEYLGSYGNSGIHWQNDGEYAGKILAAIDPLLAKVAIAVKFNGVLRSLDYFISTDGILEAVTAYQAEGYQICLNTAAFFWDKTLFELYPHLSQYSKTINDDSAVISYFSPNLFSQEEISQISRKTLAYLKSGIIPEVRLMAAYDAIQYYDKIGQWYLAEQLQAEESDYPYKFRFLDNYAEINTQLFLPQPSIIQKLLIEQFSAQALKQPICTIKLTVGLFSN